MDFALRAAIPTSSELSDAAADNGDTVIATDAWGILFVSDDGGLIWSSVLPDVSWVSVARGDDRFVALGYTYDFDSDTRAAVAAVRIDGAWTTHAVGLAQQPGARLLWTGSAFVSMTASHVMRSIDGMSWTISALPTYSGAEPLSLLQKGGDIVASGGDGYYKSTDDGLTWSFNSAIVPVSYYWATVGDDFFAAQHLAVRRSQDFSTWSAEFVVDGETLPAGTEIFDVSGVGLIARTDAAGGWSFEAWGEFSAVTLPAAKSFARAVRVTDGVLLIARDGDVYFAARDFPVAGLGDPYTVTLPVDVFGSDPQVFSTDLGVILWSMAVQIGATDVSDRLCGELSIEAAEDGARMASFMVAALTEVDADAFDGAPVTIDVILDGGGYSAAVRRFTGFVEGVEIDLGARVATVTCRDDYQATIKACISAADVRSLLGGLSMLSDALVVWDDDAPDAWSYFKEALSTVPGATFIDGGGIWRVIKWDISAPSLSYTDDDYWDGGLALSRAQRSSLPSEIVATFSLTYPRLHCATVPLSWVGLPGLEYTTRGISAPTQSIISQAIAGLRDWRLSGSAAYSNFGPETWPVDLSMSATLYRRWYQMMTRRFTVTIPMGGASDRDESISAAFSVEFDAAAWESSETDGSGLDVFAANTPTGYPPSGPAEDDDLQAPHPPSNGALDYFGDGAVVQQACRQIVAQATRAAAAGRRRQQVVMSRPVDLRLDIGVVAALSGMVSATGQVSAFYESYDHDSGAVSGDYTFACPAGDGSVTGSSVSVSLPAPDVVHALPVPALSNWVGGSADTITYVVSMDTICGHLTNISPVAAEYDADAPYYVEQFRLVMPEISEDVRDPLTETVAMDAEVHIAGGGVTLDFGDDDV